MKARLNWMHGFDIQQIEAERVHLVPIHCNPLQIFLRIYKKLSLGGAVTPSRAYTRQQPSQERNIPKPKTSGKACIYFSKKNSACTVTETVHAYLQNLEKVYRYCSTIP